MEYSNQCPYCGKDPAHEAYLKREKEVEKWARKYRNGKLKQIPSEILNEWINRPRNSMFTTSLDEYVHPAIAGYLKFNYEDMSLLEFLNIFDEEIPHK